MRKIRLWRRGATRLRFLDVIVTLVLLALLVWVAWMQFPVYHPPAAPGAKPTSAASP